MFLKSVLPQGFGKNMDIKSEINLENYYEMEGYSLFVLGPKNKFRKLFKDLAFNSYFDGMIIFLIVFSSIMLCLDSPFNDPESS